jgi:hypothetical protein
VRLQAPPRGFGWGLAEYSGIALCWSDTRQEPAKQATDAQPCRAHCAMTDAEPADDARPEELQNLFEPVKDAPCRIDQIHVSPADLQTRLLVVLREFKEARKAETFEDVLQKSAQAVANLEDLGVFHDVAGRLNPGMPVRFCDGGPVHLDAGPRCHELHKAAAIQQLAQCNGHASSRMTAHERKSCARSLRANEWHMRMWAGCMPFLPLPNIVVCGPPVQNASEGSQMQRSPTTCTQAPLTPTASLADSAAFTLEKNWHAR